MAHADVRDGQDNPDDKAIVGQREKEAAKRTAGARDSEEEL
jgi:hypothetical protein